MERQAVAKVQKSPSRNGPVQRQSAGRDSPVHPILKLQRSIGNQAVQRLMRSPYGQAKLQISTPGDKFEQEADRTAETVMRSPAGEASAPALSISRTSDHSPQRAPRDEQSVQRSSLSPLTQHPEPGEEFEQSRSPLGQHAQPNVEFKQSSSPLSQGRAHEEFDTLKSLPLHRKTEEGAQVQRKEDESVARKADEAESVQKAEALEPAQREQAAEPETGSVMPASGKGDAPAVPEGFSSDLDQTKGQGQPLSDDSRSFFENKFGADFSDVRVHTGTEASQLNKSIQAKAFTRGNNIYFSDGAYDPSSSGGKSLLAHELTHVVQQEHADGPAQRSASSEATVQREEADDSDAPTEEQKAAARAAAARARKEAQQTETVGHREVAKSKEQKNEEKKSEQESKQKAKTAAGHANEATAKAKKRKKPEAKAMPVVDQKGEDKEAAAGDKKKAPASPEEDPAFQKVVKKIGGVSKAQQKHVPAKVKADEAQAGAVAPPEEITGRAQGTHAADMEKAEAPPFDAAGFKAQLLKRIEELAPKNMEEADDFKSENKLAGVKQEMGGTVAENRDAARGPLEKTKAQGPDLKSVEPKPVTPIPDPAPGAPPPSVGANEAAPKQKTEAELEAPIQENTARIGNEFASQNITEEQLAKSNEPSFQSALASKKEAETQAAEGPCAYRQFEQGAIANAEKQARANAAVQTKGMHAQRVGAFGLVREAQGATKDKDEAARKEVGDHINGIYEKVKGEVEQILSAIDGKVEAVFDAGAEAAKVVFENYVDSEMEAYKEDRYGGWFGWARWAKDKIAGMPDEVNVFYERGRNLYLKKMDAVIDNVIAIIAADLTAAKAAIARGRKELSDYLAGLPANLQKVGAEAADEVTSKFETLDQNIDSKKDSLIDSLANKYNEKLKAIDASIEEMKAANRGLVDKAIDAIKSVINTIIELKNLLFRVLAKISEVVMNIIADPIGFLGNLIDAVKLGLDNFGANIEKHLKAGFVTWLTGSLGNLNIQMPDDVFSLPGIFSLIMQVLGLTWDYIRGKAVKLLGEPVVKALEVGFDIFQILIKEGPAGLWAYAVEKFSDLKEMVIEEIKNMLISEVIKAGIKWLLGLLNPVAAFIKAAMAIYEIVKFFITKAKQIMELIEAFIDGVAAVAKGSISGAAQLIENALAKAIPLIIGFLASLLGISGLAERVQKLIKSLRKRVDAFIDGILLKAKNYARTVMNKLSPDKRGKVVDEKEEKKDETIGKAVVAKMSEPPASEMPYPELRAQKEKQAASLVEKYNKELTPPVKLKIIFAPQKEDQADSDLDFKVHIGPNDFDMAGSVEGKAGGPDVGLHGDLTKSPVTDKHSHHVPPKGLLGWIKVRSIDAAKQLGPDVVSANPWLEQLATIPEARYDPGDPLAAIRIHKNTHIEKSDDPDDKGTYRVHWGEDTAREAFRRLKGKGLRLIFRRKFAELSDEDKLRFQRLASEAGEDPMGLASEEDRMIDAGPVLSTQFFKAELNAAYAEEQGARALEVQDFKKNLGRVAKGAYVLSRTNLVIALEKSTRDGTKEERAAAVNKLKALSTSTWESNGVEELGMFNG
jgi:hypothetical protein